MNESTSDPYQESSAERATRARGDTQSPGELLRAGREAKNFSVEDLCDETKLSEKAVKALENNEFNALSQPVFAGGYYRQCAKVLGIDTERMMRAYEAWGGKKTSQQAPPTEMDVVPQDVTPHDWQTLAMIGAGVLVVIVALFFILVPSGGDSAGEGAGESQMASSGTENSADVGMGNGSATGGAAATDRSSGNSLRVSPSDNGAGAGQAQPGTTASAGANAGAPDATSSAPSTGQRAGGRNVNETLGIDREAERAAQQAPAEPEVAPNLLVIEFTDRSWVDIRDAGGARMLNGIFEAGDSRELDGEPPYRVTLGFAPGVDMTIGGEAVDVESQTSSNTTARFTVEARDS